MFLKFFWVVYMMNFLGYVTMSSIIWAQFPTAAEQKNNLLSRFIVTRQSFIKIGSLFYNAK